MLNPIEKHSFASVPASLTVNIQPDQKCPDPLRWGNVKSAHSISCWMLFCFHIFSKCTNYQCTWPRVIKFQFSSTKRERAPKKSSTDYAADTEGFSQDLTICWCTAAVMQYVTFTMLWYHRLSSLINKPRYALMILLQSNEQVPGSIV